VSRESSLGVALLAILCIVLPIIVDVAIADESDSEPNALWGNAEYSGTVDGKSEYSSLVNEGNAFDAQDSTAAFLQANRCDGGSADCSEGTTFIRYRLFIQVRDSTNQLRILWATVANEDTPSDGRGFITLQDASGECNPMAKTIGSDYNFSGPSSVIETIVEIEPCHKHSNNTVNLWFYVSHSGSDSTADEAAMYLFSIYDEVSSSTSCISDVAEPNDDLSSAFSVVNSGQNIQYSGLYACQNENDYYSVDIRCGDIFSFFVEFQHDQGDIEIQLLNSQGLIVVWGTSTTDNEEIEPLHSEGNFTVFLRVWLFSDSDDSPGNIYSLSVNISPLVVYDEDGDGVPDHCDDFPQDSNETTDTDGDGTGDNADTDDDDDGFSDEVETSCESDPLSNSLIPLDTDQDGSCDPQDGDDDNDGYADTEDDLPLDPNETTDTDGDGIGDNTDTDDDGDGVSDSIDFYPLDSSQHLMPEGCHFDSIQRLGHVSYYSYSSDDPLGSVPETQINQHAHLDWDLDGFDNSIDFFPIDVSRAVMPACGNSFGVLSPNPTYHIDPSGISSIDGLVVVDWDRDGDYDIIIGGTTTLTEEFSGMVMGIENQGDGTFAPPVNMKNLGQYVKSTVPSLSGDVDEIALMDLRDDGSLGLIIGTHGWTRYYDSANSPWAELYFTMHDENPWADDDIETQRARDIIVADVNNDGKHDWAISYRTTSSYEDGWVPRVEIFDNSDIYSRPVGTKLETGEVKYHINWFDPDSDGNLDLLMCKVRCQIFDILGREKWSYMASDAIWTSAWTDFDKDGDYDLAIGGEGGNIYIFQMQGSLPEEPTIILSNGYTARSLHWADIDGDGWQDLLVGNDGKDHIFANREGHLSLVWESSSSKMTNYIMTADIDLDGDLDIIGSDVSSVFIIENSVDENAAYDAALNRMSGAYFWIATILGSILLLRSISLLYGWQSKFLLLGLALFALAGMMWWEMFSFDPGPLQVDGYPSIVSQCSYNEDCVAARWLENSTFFSQGTEGVWFPPASESGYNSISGILLIPIFLGVLALLSLVKHYRKTNFVTGTGPSEDIHSKHAISSLSGVSYYVAVVAILYPGYSIYHLNFVVFAAFAITGLVLGRRKNSLAAITEVTGYRKVPSYRVIANGWLKWLNLASPLLLVISLLLVPLWSNQAVHPNPPSSPRAPAGQRTPIRQHLVWAKGEFEAGLRQGMSKSAVPSPVNSRKCSICGQTGHDKRTCQLSENLVRGSTSKKRPRQICSQTRCKNQAGSSGFCGLHKGILGQSQMSGIDPAVVKLIEDSGRSPEDIIADLLDDGILNFSAGSDAVATPEQENTKKYATGESSTGLTPAQSSDVSRLKSLKSLKDWLAVAYFLEATTDFSEIRRIHTGIGNIYLKTAKSGMDAILAREIMTLGGLGSKNLGRLIPKVFFADEDIPLLVMEQSGQVTLAVAMQSMGQGPKLTILTDLARDIRTMHDHGHVHRDLKPGNITISGVSSTAGERYHGLIDFGSALRINRRQGLDPGGMTRTRFYGHKSQEEPGFRAHEGQDWYSFARLAMCLVTGELPLTLRSMIEGGSIASRISTDFNGLPDDDAKDAIKEIIMLSCSPEGESNAGLENLKKLGMEI